MDKSGQNAGALSIGSTTDLLTYALALESEASERYAELADQMRTHNNTDVAELFQEMSRIEQLHVDSVLELAASFDVQDISARTYRWEEPDGPETTDMGEAHYLMTPHHALRLALHNEKRAQEFFAKIAAEATDNELVLLATEMAAEEQEHVALMEAWVARYPQPADDWADDPDPAIGRD